MMSVVYNIQNGFWLVLKVESLCRSRREGVQHVHMHVRVCVCAHTQSGFSLCYIVDYNSVKPSLYTELH